VPTQAQIRATRKERVRNVKRSLKRVDTQVEVMQRRLEQLLVVEREVSTKSWDSFLKMYDELYFRLTVLERVFTSVMGLFMSD